MRNSLWSRTSAKIRYYWHGLPLPQALLRILIDGAAKLGVRIEPFQLMHEGLSLVPPAAHPPHADGYAIRFLTAQDMASVAAIPGRLSTEADLHQRLRQGKRCLGISQAGSLVAFTWCDLDTCYFEDFSLFSLQANEAYLFDAYTVETNRGSGLAPFMRYRMYEELEKLGKDKCYSITVLFNAPAARFKAKLGARVIELHLLVEIFRRWRFHHIVRRYRHDRLS